MSPEEKLIASVVICTVAIVATLLTIHIRHSRLVEALTQRLDEAEKNQTKALGEWSRGMGQHISDSIAGLISNTKTLQSQHQDHSKSIAVRHEDLSKDLHRQMEILVKNSSQRHDEAISLLGEQHRRNLEKLAERNELSNKELNRQYGEVLATLKSSLESLEARLEKTDLSNKELRQSISELRNTLESAVKL